MSVIKCDILSFLEADTTKNESQVMIIATSASPDTDPSCSNCRACCCRLEVMLITETGVPERYIDIDKWGGSVMARLEDGWCAALDRDTMMCTIYEQRPLICRDFEEGEYECIAERAEYLPATK